MSLESQWEDNGSSAIRAIAANAAGNDVVITETGRLGIGVATPSNTLDVRNAGGTQAAFIGNATEAKVRLQTYAATGNASLVYKNGNGQYNMGLFNDRFRLDLSGTGTRLVIDSDGDMGLGIGNADADNRLHVSATADPVKFEGCVTPPPPPTKSSSPTPMACSTPATRLSW